MESVKKFLGTGWKFPLGVSADGKLAVSSYEDGIRESILIILGTAKGERVMRPTFGCGIHDYVFETINSSTVGRIKSSIEEALIKWEPRIILNSIDVNADSIDDGKLLISINYSIRSTNNQFNLVYPFYITEGTESS